MFGIGLPEMIVILAVALIVVGPEKLPDMARSVAKWMFELKKTVNQVKNSLAEEDNIIGSVHSDLKKAAGDLKGNLLESDENFTWHEPGTPTHSIGEPDSDVIDMNDLQPVEEPPGAPEKGTAANVSHTEDGEPEQGAESEAGPQGPGEKPA